MKSKALRYIVILATFSIAGVFLVQLVFLRSSYNFMEKQFRESTSVALKEVAWQILLAGGNSANFDSITPVEPVTGNCYLVNVDATIDDELLKSNLIEQLRKHEIYVDFEYAIFNPETGQMDEGTYVSSNLEEKPSDFEFPLNEKYTNYFGIHFPNRSEFFITHLSIWFFITGLLIVVILFFGYTLWVIIRQRQLSEVQKNFINNLTHELKTPISSIALSAKVLSDEKIVDSPERLIKYANIIQEQNERLSKNVEKVLNLASLEKNKIKLSIEDINLSETIVETVDKFLHTDYGRNAEIRYRFNETDVIIPADKFYFTNLILNILENAVKYCEKEPLIEISVTRNRKRYELAFADNGIGIPKEQRKKIFTKFYRIPTGNVHNVKGFGLGLDYVKKIVVAHKWKIKVDDNPGGGSIFTIFIKAKT